MLKKRQSKDFYLRLVDYTPLLTREEEVALFQQIEEANFEIRTAIDELRGFLDPMYPDRQLERIKQAKKRIAEANQRMVIEFAIRYGGHGLPRKDLIQEGNLGLMKAMDKFDYRRGVKFATYARWWIRQSTTRAISDKARIIRIPVHIIESLIDIGRARKACRKNLGREPTKEEIASELGWSLEKVERCLAAPSSKDIIPLESDEPETPEEDEVMGSVLGKRLADAISDPLEAGNPESLVLRANLKEKTAEILQTLDSLKEQEILDRIRGIERKAMRRLKKKKKNPK